MTRVRNTFLPNEITTKGSMSQPVRVTKDILSVIEEKKEVIKRTVGQSR